MLGNKNNWSNRSLNYTHKLNQNARDGIGGMPAKGLCQTCSFEEIKLAVQYMLEKI